MTEPAMANRGAALVIGVGAKSGLGAALARRFAREGLRVVVAGRTPERLRSVAEQIAATGGAVAIKVADATSEADVAALFDEADRDGDLALVAYNVGNNIAASAQDTTPELFERLWRQNALGGFVVG
ncbi:MAG: SDR family NAD(P)-dependent oxidoreductase, partial [Methylocystis silviterrae]|uniref:SDR family NAD(P)-dependent oxidoreductase n=1 Tax=Methylocystis silviterrae TaxID=2743612 RepID=UPI003C782A57